MYLLRIESFVKAETLNKPSYRSHEIYCNVLLYVLGISNPRKDDKCYYAR